jgi:Mg2+ and Co2+ transporter CorA
MAEDKLSVVTVNTDQLLEFRKVLESMERRIQSIEKSVHNRENNMKDLSEQMLMEYKSKVHNLSETYESLINKKESICQSSSKLKGKLYKQDVREQIHSLFTEISIEIAIGRHMSEIGSLR